MSPDYENIACQLEATFPSNPNNPNHLSLKIIEDGNNEEIPGDYQSFLATELFTGKIIHMYVLHLSTIFFVSKNILISNVLEVNKYVCYL